MHQLIIRIIVKFIFSLCQVDVGTHLAWNVPCQNFKANFSHYNFSNANFEKFLRVFSGMSMGIKVAELNTLSDGKGITGIQVFNEMEDTNESTNLRILADVWMSKNRCCQGHRNRSACLSLESNHC